MFSGEGAKQIAIDNDTANEGNVFIKFISDIDQSRKEEKKIGELFFNK